MESGRKRVQGTSVAVFGAGGHTGRFVVAELLARGLRPIALGRDRARLEQLGFAQQGVEIREAAIDHAASLERAFEGTAAVINCAGPFLDTAEPVASAAVRAGIHYLDVTAEQESARATLESFDAPARAAGVVMMPAMGFYGGFADLLVSAALGGRDSADEISIAIALDSWHPTQGTRLTGARNTYPRMVVSGGKMVPLTTASAELHRDFPEPFGRQKLVELPFSEVILIARHVRTAELHTYLGEVALRDIRDPATTPPSPADDRGRSAQRFLVDAMVARGGERQRIAAQGQDIYAFSAPLVCEAVERILDGRSQGAGALAPGSAFDARDFLDALAPAHLTFKLEG